MFEARITRKGAGSWPSWLQTGWQGPRQWAGRAKKRLLWSLKSSSLLRALKDRRNTSLARLKHSRLGSVTFIGVTGSCAKTTTCIFTKAILLPGDRWQEGSHQNVADAILRVDLTDKYHVQELSADAPGKLARSLSLLQPQIGIVTVIGEDHYKHYRGREGVAREKGQLIEALPSTGVAVLNADDPLVLAMASRTMARVLTYGYSPTAEVRATSASSDWPEPLKLVVAHGDESVAITTQFYGEHWATAVLAGIACGVACGRDLKSCATAIEKVTPIAGRYSLHRTPRGVNFVLDSFKAPYWTIASGLNFVKKANAPRKTAIFGAISDYSGTASRVYRRVARGALEVADRVIFVGPHSTYVDKLKKGPDEARLFTFMTSFQACEFLVDSVADELIYVKDTTEHLERLMLAQSDQVVCWRERCGIKGFCPKCLYYRKPTPPPLGLSQEGHGVRRVA
jgi:UDP-N-acetylmuramoyl-tripeptide--D-alanyl-D-alanine ligase